ncbi:MAG TPA: site-specific integrase [Mycobacterium sp.]
MVTQIAQKERDHMPGKQGRRGWGYTRRLPPSKRWQASYIGPDGVRHYASSTFAAKMDAERWLGDERRLIDRDVWTPPNLRAAAKRSRKLTLSEYATTWIAQRKLTPRTRGGYESQQARLIDPVIGRLPLCNISAETVRGWYAGLDDKHPTRNAQVYALLHAICDTAVTDELMLTNPCTIRGAMNAPTKRTSVVLSVQEVNALAEAITPERFKAMVLITAWCGLRWGEVIELRRKDIGPGCESIIVTRAVTHRQGCHISVTKEKRHKTVAVPPHIQSDIKHHLDSFVAEDVEALLFPPAKGGCHLNDKSFRGSYFEPALKAIGRSDAVFHDLRHFAGTSTARVANLVETMARLGHSTAKASLIYQQVASGRDREVAEALSALAVGARQCGQTPRSTPTPPPTL